MCDVEELMANGDENAKLAYEMYTDRVAKYIAEYYIKLDGKVDGIVFTAGVGENAIKFREDIVDKVSVVMGVRLNKEENNKIAKFLDVQRGIISTEDSKFDVMVIPTNEEYMILKDTYEIAQNLKEKQKSRVLR